MESTHFTRFLKGVSSATMVILRRILTLPSGQRFPSRTSGRSFEELCEADDNILGGAS